MNKKLIEMIWKKIEKRGSYNLGIYERTYPDCLDSTTRGFFSIELDINRAYERDSNGGIIPESITLSEANYYVNGNEKILSHWIRGMGLDTVITKVSEIKSFFVNWISKFKTLKHLYDKVWNASDFLKPKNDWRVRAFQTLESDLPDGTTLETFLSGGL